MAYNDVPTGNAAFSAACAGAGAFITDATAADYATITAAASAFAVEVDALLFAGAGAGANANRNVLMEALCRQIWTSRNILNTPSPTVAASYAGVAAAIVAQYTNAKGTLQ